MRRIARAAELNESDYARPLKLAELAAAADMSPYHFVRSFGSLVGVPPHRYLIAVRLREAVRQILDGANVTGACYAVGFSTPSHFTAAFRQRFGVVPSALLRGRNPALIRALNVGPWGRYVVALRRADPAIAKGA
jgi:AraC-like DNA-binding protein